jgi:hypothetical protein
MGRSELHHVHPRYFRGPSNGARVPLPAEYHQLITNAFQERIPYGQASTFSSDIIDSVMEMSTPDSQSIHSDEGDS